MFDTSSEMVAGVHIERVWKFKSKVRRTSSADVILKICKKKSFSRHFMEKTLGLTTGQAYWYISRLLRAGVIQKLNTEFIDNKGNHQALYKFIGQQ